MPCELIQENVEPQPQSANYAQALFQGLKTIISHPLTRCITERALLHALEAWSSTDLFVPLGIAALVCLDLGCGRWMPHTSVLGEFQRTVRQAPGKAFGKLALTVGLKGFLYHRFFTSTSVPDLSKNTVFAVPFEERGLIPFNSDLSNDICVPQAVCGIYDAHPVVYAPRTVLDFFPAVPLALNTSTEEQTSTFVPDLSKNTVFAVPFEEGGLVPFKPDLSKDICVPQAVCGIYDAHPVVYSPRTVLDFFPAVPLALNTSTEEKTSTFVADVSKNTVCAIPFEERGLIPFNSDLSNDICVPQAVCGIYDAHPVVYSPRTVLDFSPAVPLALNTSTEEKTESTYESIRSVCVSETRLEVFKPTFSAGGRSSVNGFVLTPALYALTSGLNRAASYLVSGITSCIQDAKRRLGFCALEDQ
jgi:hypothetical protein